MSEPRGEGREPGRRPPWRRSGCWLGFLVVLTVVIGVRTLVFRSLLYPVPPVAVGAPPDGLEEVEVTGEGGVRARGWARAGSRPGAPALLVFHGNGENLGTMLQAGTFDDLGRLDAPFLALDFPGYGRSPGRPSQTALVSAGVAGLATLAERHPGAPIVVVGWSLGGATAVATAAARPEAVAGLALFESWADLPSLANHHFPTWLVDWAVVEPWDSATAARELRQPALLVHGDADEAVPIGEGRRLRDAFADRVRWVEVAGAGHNDLLSRAEVWRELGRFVDRFRHSSSSPSP